MLCYRTPHDFLQFLDGSITQLLDAWKLLEQKGGLNLPNPWDLLHSLNKGELREPGALFPEERVLAGLSGLLLNLRGKIKEGCERPLVDR